MFWKNVSIGKNVKLKMTSLSLKDATELVAKYAARASSESADFTVSSPCRLCRSGFGAAVGRSWPLSPTDCWVRLDIATLSQPNVPLPQTGKLSLSQQLQTRRALLELICQLSATPSCRWPESVESLWWPAVLRPTDFKDEKYLETVYDIGPKPRFALSTGRPTLESVQMLYQFLQMDHKELLLEEDWQLMKSLRVSVSKRERQRVEICFRLANNVVDTSILRSMADGLREYLDVKAWREEKDEYPRIEFQITELWFHNCRFLNGSEDLKLLAQIVTLPSSTISSLMLPGVFFNSLRNPAGCRVSSRLLDEYWHPVHWDTIRGAHSNSRLVWAWIFLAVFHVDSGCELEHFDVSGLQLQTDVVEILTAMLDSPHPGRTVVLLQDGRLPEGEGCEECELPLNERLFVRLLDGAQAWTNPGGSAAWPQLLPETLQPSGFEYEVMVRLTDWLCILIPGYGFGWVVRSAVRYQVSKPSQVRRISGVTARAGLQSLTYRGLQEQSEGVVDLLRLLGSSLTCVDVPLCGLNSQALETILRACPNLVSLNVTGNVMSDLSPLQVLLLHSNAKCLKSLQLETINSGADSNNSEKIIWTQMERALLANSSLRCLHLSLPSADSYEAATSLIKPFHGQILRYHTPMRLKTAFLSVVEHVTSPLFMRALDHMVLSNVFSFAATSAIRRQVNVRR
ncbi:Leucine-rich repeat domain, L domain-like [Phytophthora cactorum]|nr:Leucine-rich repeat domain, L domain-like [Phytophthora cactorum]